MKYKHSRIVAALAAVALSASLLAGCSTPAASQSSASPAVDYGLGLDSNGYYEGITAMDYVTLPENHNAVPVQSDDVTPNEGGYADFYKYIIQMAGTTTEVTDRAIQADDMVTLDLTSSTDGVNLADGTLQDYTVVLGYGAFLDEFEEQLIGHSTGDSFTISIVYPQDAGTTQDENGNEVDLSGKTVDFAVTIKDVMDYELTDENVSDAFANTTTMADGTPVTSVDQLHDYYLESETTTNLQNAIIDYLLTNSTVKEIPESILEQQKEVERQYAEYVASIYNYGTVDEFLTANSYSSMDEYIETAMDSIQSNIEYRLIIQAIAEADNLSVEDEAYMKAFGAAKGVVEETYGEEYAAQMALEYTVLTYLAENAQMS